MKQPVLKIYNLKKTFGRKPILNNVNLEVHNGEILGIIGPSGSGKTTFLNTIIGFVKPDSGSILFHNKDSKYVNMVGHEKSVTHKYGFAAQFPSFYEKLTVKENLEYFGKLYNLSLNTLKANTETLLKLMSLENSSNVLAKNLSGGMKRRLDIACAMVHNPDILILDEPTADLDPVLRNNIWNLIEKINSNGTTIILSSHHLSELETLCNRIAVLQEGTIKGVAGAEELKSIFFGDQDILIQSYPGNYSTLGPFLLSAFQEISSYDKQGTDLLIKCKNPQELLKDIISSIEGKGERIIEVKIVRPSLDQLFINNGKGK